MEFEKKIEPFRRFRDAVLEAFHAEIERDGEDTVILRQAELSVEDGGFGVSKPTAKKLLEFLKVDEETRREAQQEWLVRQNEEAGQKPK